MGRRKGSQHGNAKGEALAVRELIRGMVVEGVPEPLIVRRIVAGVVIPPSDGTKRIPAGIYKLSRASVYRHLQALGEEWRALHDDPLVQERVFGATIESIRRIAGAAERAGKYGDAIRAHLAVARLYGIRSSRWREATSAAREGEAPTIPADNDPAVLGVVARAREIAQLSDDELVERRRQVAARLEVHEGGRKVGGE